MTGRCIAWLLVAACLAAPKHEDSYRFPIEVRAQIVGQEKGQPVLVLLERDESRREQHYLSYAFSDAGGMFRLRIERAGTYWISAYASPNRGTARGACLLVVADNGMVAFAPPPDTKTGRRWASRHNTECISGKIQLVPRTGYKKNRRQTSGAVGQSKRGR